MMMGLAHVLFLLLSLRFVQLSSADSVRSGNYFILKCGAGQEGSLASDLQKILPKIWGKLQNVIADAGQGTASQHGFETFFHGNNNIVSVQKVYQDIADGSPVPQTTRGRATNPLLNLGYPSIVCIQPGDPETAIPYADCATNPLFLAAKSDNFVALCPGFWELDTEATIDKCPRVRNNILSPNTDSLNLNQEAVLLHELTHVYGVVPLQSWQEGVFERYTVRDAANLDEQSAIRNAPNYAFYYSAINAGCTQWPDPAQPQRGLLQTTEINATNQVILDNGFAVPPVVLDLCNSAVYAPNASVCCDTTSGLWIPSEGGPAREGEDGLFKAAC